MQLDLKSPNDELDKKNKEIKALRKKLDMVSELAAGTPLRSSSKGRLLHPLMSSAADCVFLVTRVCRLHVKKMV